MAGLLDWISDGGMTSPIFGSGTTFGGAENQYQQQQPMPPVQPYLNDVTKPDPGSPTPLAPQPPPYATGGDPVAGSGSGNDPGLPFATGGDPVAGSGSGNNGGIPFAQGGDPVNGSGSGNNGGLPQPPPPPMPQPRPGVPPGQPLSLAPQQPGPTTAPPTSPAQSWLGRALGITDKQTQQIGSGLAAGLKSVPGNTNQPGLAAFSGSAGSAMEGSQQRGDLQQKQMSDYLKSAIDAKKAGDDAGYKQNYLRYLAAKLQADTDKAAKSDASSKLDTPTQLYLKAQERLAKDPYVRTAQDALKQAQKEGNGAADPAVIAAQQNVQKVIAEREASHLATLGLHPQTAAEVAKQPGNAADNPIDAGKLGITKDNIGQKLQPGQYFVNPADGKVYQYKGGAKGGDSGSGKKAVPDKPTNPEPANPMNKGEVSRGATGKAGAAGASDDDDED